MYVYMWVSDTKRTYVPKTTFLSLLCFCFCIHQLPKQEQGTASILNNVMLIAPVRVCMYLVVPTKLIFLAVRVEMRVYIVDYVHSALTGFLVSSGGGQASAAPTREMVPAGRRSSFFLK